MGKLLFIVIASLSLIISSTLVYADWTKGVFISDPDKCEAAPDVSDPAFCSAFKEIAQCHCKLDGKLPDRACEDMKKIYSRMVAVFGSQSAACKWQEDHGSEERRPYPICMQDWDCYRLGGADCSGTGPNHACS